MQVLPRKWPILVCLILLLTSCASGSSAELTSSSFSQPSSVEVSFEVSVPSQTAAGETVVFVLLDPVTGLGANPQYFQMDASGDDMFSVSLSVSQGSLLHYRYARQGQALVGEVNPFGETINYRLYLVDGPGHSVSDFVSMWEDLPLTQPTGRLLGSIGDSGTGTPLPGIQVSAGGLHTQTDTEGHFELRGLSEGLHTLVAYTQDGSFLTFQQGAVIAADTDTPAELHLGPSKMALVTLLLTLPEDSVPGIPVYMAGNLPQFAEAGPLSQLPDGRYSISIELPTNSDIRYKYTLGDGYWNGEQSSGGGFLLRQLVLPNGLEALEVEDQIFAWTMDGSAPIWFDLVAENTDGQSAYIQFKLADWTPALAMWPLGGGHFAYKLYNPTNFASPLEYRYCLDEACTQPELGREVRYASGNLDSAQIIEDQVQDWGE